MLARVFGLVARLNGMCPAGTRAFLFLLFWPPPAGADGGLLGAAAPPRPPLHSPRTTPLGLSPISTPTDWPLGAFHTPSFREGCAAYAPGASSLRSAISLRAAQCQRALSPCVRSRKRYAYPPHAQREGYALCERPKGIYTAPNRPPAARRTGGQINIKGNAAMPAGHMPFNRATSQKFTSKHEPLLAAQAPQMNILIIMTNQAAPNTRNNHSYPPSVYNALDPMRHLGQFPMQREGVRWHCAARREIAERSEEAPGA